MQRRAHWLAMHPLCKACDEGTPRRVTAGTIVDHVIPLFQGGKDDESNLQTLCGPHHDAKSIREKGGTPQPRIGLDGFPIEPSIAAR
jgi:5-methylcytosine-specific restriction protein A